MTRKVEITPSELALILEALDDAAYYRDSRSRVLKGAVKRSSRRLLLSPASLIPTDESSATDVHRRKAQAYGALAIKLAHQTDAAAGPAK
jgi:hypothetical protein